MVESRSSKYGALGTWYMLPCEIYGVRRCTLQLHNQYRPRYLFHWASIFLFLYFPPAGFVEVQRNSITGNHIK